MYIFSPCSYVKNLRKNKKIEKENKEKKFLSEEEKKDKKKKNVYALAPFARIPTSGFILAKPAKRQVGRYFSLTYASFMRA